ncbi:MAG: sulfatase [Planctomycetales bacterium]|nr:sulfatase [Planctomycetales bacterium]
MSLNESQPISSALCLLAFLSTPFGLRDARAEEENKKRQPNVVFILADDLGWSDLGCYGADYHESPCIDNLAREGILFRSAYAMPVCSPTRAAILTGKHAARLHMTIWSEGSRSGPRNRKLLQANSNHDLALEEITIAERLQSAGYLTAMIGKWHLGDAEHYPETQGFDVNIGGTHWGAPQTFFWPYNGDQRFGGFRYVPGLHFGQPGEYLTDRLTDEAVRVIERAGDRPFFLYLAHHAPHTPIEAKEADINYFRHKPTANSIHQNPEYAAMIKSLDESVGRVMECLEKNGVADETIVVFASDNGGYIGQDPFEGQPLTITSNAPLRSGKGSLYEGGIRVPLIIRASGAIKGAQCTQPVMVTDLYTTILTLCGLENAESLDGINLTPVLFDPETPLEPRALFFHYPHYYPTTTPVGAIRMGDYKLLEYFEDDRLELYDLAADLGESNNLAATHADLADRLRLRLSDWRQKIDAQMPTPNPDFSSKVK